jgi:predicted nucleotidyltransferase
MHERIHILKKVCERFDLAALYAFGSRAKEAFDWSEGLLGRIPESQSDIDIGVKTRGLRLSADQKASLAAALEDVFQCGRVDLVFLDEAGPFLALEIVQGERLFAVSSFEADEFDLFVMRRAGDLMPLERERAALVLGERP